MPENSQNETSRLLDAPRVSRSLTEPTLNRGSLGTSKRVVPNILLLQFITNFAYYHLLAPRLRMLELTLCRTHYLKYDPSIIHTISHWPGYNIDESKCKLGVVQQRLSALRGSSVFLDGLVVLFLSIPLGILADRYGRRLVYSMCHTGLLCSNVWFMLVCTFPDRIPATAVLASSAFLVLGGGSSVQNAMAMTIGVDSSGPEQSSTMLYRLLAMYYLGYICGNGLAPITMKLPWLPFCLSFSSLAISLLLTALMPYRQSRTPVSLTEPSSHVGDSDDSGTVSASMAKSPSKLRHFGSQVLEYMRSHVQLVILLTLFPLMAIRGPVIELLLPYVSNRYHWSLAKASFLDALGGIVGLVLGVCILPKITRHLTQYRSFAPVKADSTIVIYSVLALALGALIVAAAPRVVFLIIGYIIYATGAGGRMGIVSVVTVMVKPQQVGRLNTFIATSEVLADLTISPLMWYLWSSVLDKNSGATLGLPFYLVSLVMCLVLFAFYFTMRDALSKQSPCSTGRTW